MNKDGGSVCDVCQSDITPENKGGELWLTERTEYSFVQRDEAEIPHECGNAHQERNKTYRLCDKCFQRLLRNTVYKKEMI